MRSFALAKYDVTRTEYAEFVYATGHVVTGCGVWDGQHFTKSETAGWRSPGFSQTDRSPVVCVDLEDVQAYIQWYSAKTGHAYRLPTEGEWEYAARAGTTTSWFWGDDPGNQCNFANGADHTMVRQFPEWAGVACSDGYLYTSPVGSFQPNPWGLYDMLGNVWQRTEDCWNESYAGAPSNGDAWTTGDCTRRVIRGGSWFNSPGTLRSAFRVGVNIGDRDVTLGFRLARTLP